MDGQWRLGDSGACTLATLLHCLSGEPHFQFAWQVQPGDGQETSPEAAMMVATSPIFAFPL